MVLNKRLLLPFKQAILIHGMESVLTQSSLTWVIIIVY